MMKIYPRRYCVYTHSVNGAVFYVGKGSKGRPLSFWGRNSKWVKNVEACEFFEVDIIGWFEGSSDALRAEREESERHGLSATFRDNFGSRESVGARSAIRTAAVELSAIRSEIKSEEKFLAEELRGLIAPHGSGRKLAESIGITPQYLSDVVNGRRRVSDAVVQKLMEL